MKIILKILFVLMVTIFIGSFIISSNEKKVIINTDTSNTGVSGDTQTPIGEPVFTWSYEPIDESAEIPRTSVSLTANYPDGNKITKQIEVIQGGDCNEYQSPDQDVYPKSEMIICYYAGFGEYYKVVKDVDKYLVKRKMFEEASPDYNPPQAQFEVLAEF